jgi:anti-sigma B factor antagonist
MRSVNPLSDSTPAEAFRIEIQPNRHRVLVAPHGELDIDTAAGVADEIDGLVERGFSAIVIDLRPTTFIDSTGVHLLLHQAARTDARITIIDGPEVVSRVFDLAGVRASLTFETMQ